MNKSNASSVKLIAWFLVMICTYGALVLSNYILQAYINSLQSSINKDALAIEEKRAREVDAPAITAAIKDGFEPVIPPVWFDYGKMKPELQMLQREYAFVPLGAQPLKSVYYCNEGYGLIRYKSDRFGFRNNDEVWSRETKNQVLLIGDSFVHGACVEDQYSIAGRLGRQFEIINLGMSGNGPLNYALTARTFIGKLKPRIVIVIFFSNDNEHEYDSIFENNNFTQQNNLYTNHTVALPTLQQFYHKAIKIAFNDGGVEQNTNSRNTLFRRLKPHLQLSTIRRLISAFIENQQLSVSSKLAIDLTVEECRKHGCKPVFAYIPTSDFWRPDPRAKQYSSQLKNYIQYAYPDIGFVDTTFELNSLGREAYAPAGPHLSKEGYRLVSDAIHELLY